MVSCIFCAHANVTRVDYHCTIIIKTCILLENVLFLEIKVSLIKYILVMAEGVVWMILVSRFYRIHLMETVTFD